MKVVAGLSAVEQETDAGVTLSSVALSAGEGGRRSINVEQETDAGVSDTLCGTFRG